MCQIDQREGTVSFAAIGRVLRELFAKNHGGSIPPTPPQVRGLRRLYAISETQRQIIMPSAAYLTHELP